MSDLKLRWYCFTFNGKCRDRGLDAVASTYQGLYKDSVTFRMLRKFAENAGLKEGAVLINKIYLFEGTRDEFLDGHPGIGPDLPLIRRNQ